MDLPLDSPTKNNLASGTPRLVRPQAAGFDLASAPDTDTTRSKHRRQDKRVKAVDIKSAVALQVCSFEDSYLDISLCLTTA
ncbi:hypothetical protein ElyMa_001626600 [Elysia marginata]|uniref:Uncharacterized protein n=1 Tax=Elysia marginata TaxID=1093978 RepID=A0AAV4JKQ0_9GAST|nr:hypothetical protein ElyMa_001626600 [Elysia marginata]